MLLLILQVHSGCQRVRGKIVNLTVEYMETPLGIDVEQPRFGWQMTVGKGERGLSQVACQLAVEDESGTVVWNTGRVETATSLAIRYEGTPLQPCTRYRWNVVVWDREGRDYHASSWFETGMMDPDPGAWSGAQWIGGNSEDLVLYAPYLEIFRLKFKLVIEEGSYRFQSNL